MAAHNQPLNLRVFCCRHVLEEQAPITLVFSDDDFTFVCAHEHDWEMDGELRALSLGALLEIDPSIEEVLRMDIGYEAERRSINDPWVITKSADLQ